GRVATGSNCFCCPMRRPSGLQEGHGHSPPTARAAPYTRLHMTAMRILPVIEDLASPAGYKSPRLPIFPLTPGYPNYYYASYLAGSDAKRETRVKRFARPV